MNSNEFNVEYTKQELPPRFRFFGIILLLIGIAAFVLSFFVDQERASFNTIIAFMFTFSIGVGSLFLVALEFVVGADWSVPFRRVSEFLALGTFIAFLFVLPLLFNMHEVFHWTHHEAVKNDEILNHKAPYLNETFFYIRSGAAFVIFAFFYYVIIKKSRKLDESFNPKINKSVTRWSAIFMPVFAVVLTYMAIDWMMSLEPHWFSTIFGVYYFSGTILAALAGLTLFSLYLNENGLLPKGIRRDHYYNFGALMFAFINFWAYIAFSQFLLIWYANVPEETFWFIYRMDGPWGIYSIGLIIVHFVIPYALLLPRPAKSDPRRLKIASVWILLAHYYDLYFLIMPTYARPEIPFGWMEVLMPILPVGLIIFGFGIAARGKNLIPVGDPKLRSGMEFHL